MFPVSMKKYGRFALRAATLMAVFSLSQGCSRASSTPRSVENAEMVRGDVSLAEPAAPPKGPPNPLQGSRLFVDPDSLAALQAKTLRKSDRAKADVIDRIASQPQALWIGGWNTNVLRSVEHYVGRAEAALAVPVLVAYNIPLRDCGQHSAGGLSTLAEYKRWISDVAQGIGDRAAVVILEPDALGHFQQCLSSDQKQERMAALNYGVRVLRSHPHVAVYLDAGHSRWVPAEEMAGRLIDAGVEYANGFALNTSNYGTTAENLAYGRKLSALVGDAHFVIDTSRNGAGPFEGGKTPEDAWCNPPGRKLGAAPTTATEDPLCDGYLWLKRPGESDGECNGGPRAGVWWEEQALKLAE